MTKPQRIKLERRKGWRLQEVSKALNGLPAVKVDRSTKWGNPLRAGMWRDYTKKSAVRDFEKYINREPSVRTFENAFGAPPSKEKIREQLKGKNLACWCDLDEPCHAEILLEIANT